MEYGVWSMEYGVYVYLSKLFYMDMYIWICIYVELVSK